MLTVVARAGEEGDRAAFVTGAASTPDAAPFQRSVNSVKPCEGKDSATNRWT